MSEVKPWHLFMASKPKLTEDLVQKRLDQCLSCEHLIQMTKQCKKCGCFMQLKTKLEKATCPLGKW